MRDRLGHLHKAQTDSEGFSTVELSGRSEHEEDPNPDLDGILKEAQRIRLEIQQIQNDIGELKEVNYQALNKTSFPVATKRDSNAIGVDIKRRGEAVLQQLHRINDLRGELEAQRGSSDPAARIARTQYHYLSNALREVMFSYNEAEMSHREACKRHIQRQMEVVGREVSEEGLDEMMEGEELCVFSVQVMGQTAHSALVNIESRHRELRELEKRIEGIQELFLDVAVLIEEQGAGVENIEKNVQNAGVIVQEGTFQLDRALASDKNNPFKKMFCGCFPCKMKDRLCELQNFPSTPSEEESGPNGIHAHSSEDEELLEQHAIVFQGEDMMDSIYKEAQTMRKEMLLLKLDVKRLGKQNTRFLTSVRRFSSIKRDSNALGRDIKARGEAIYARLEKLGKLSKDLEEEHGPTSAVARMVRSQYVSLTSAFHEAISEFNEAEMTQRENCKTRIQRQAEIMGKEVSREQIDEMIETGKWNIFSDNLLQEGRTARSALNEIENRHKELLELESRIRDIHELFFQLALLVEEQGCMLDNIEANVGATQDYVAKAAVQIKKAVKYKKNNPCKKLFCCCFPCCK
ncbi:syntaxin-11a [Anableps anableps]